MALLSLRVFIWFVLFIVLAEAVTSNGNSAPANILASHQFASALKKLSVVIASFSIALFVRLSWFWGRYHIVIGLTTVVVFLLPAVLLSRLARAFVPLDIIALLFVAIECGFFALRKSAPGSCLDVRLLNQLVFVPFANVSAVLMYGLQLEDAMRIHIEQHCRMVSQHVHTPKDGLPWYVKQLRSIHFEPEYH